MTLFRGVLVAGLVAAVAVPASAQTVRRLDATHVSVKAQGVPLSQLLEDLREVADFEVVLLDPKVEKAPVTAVIERAPIATVVTDVLKQAGVSFAVGGLQGQAMRVVIREVGAPAPAQAARAEAAVEVAPAPEPAPEPAPAVVAENVPSADDAAPADTTAGIQAAMALAGTTSTPANVPAPVVQPDGASDTLVTSEYTMVGETVTHHDSTFVPYKLRPEVVARRKAMDVSTIP